MALLRILSVVVGGLTTRAVIVLGRFAVGIPVLGALGGRAAVPGPALPAGAVEAAVVLAGAVGGFVTAWVAPDRPLMHALALGTAGWGLLTAAALLGPPGGLGVLFPLLLPLAVLTGGWISVRVGATGGVR